VNEFYKFLAHHFIFSAVLLLALVFLLAFHKVIVFLLRLAIGNDRHDYKLRIGFILEREPVTPELPKPKE